MIKSSSDERFLNREEHPDYQCIKVCEKVLYADMRESCDLPLSQPIYPIFTISIIDYTQTQKEFTMDKVIINDLLVRGIIGVNDWERNRAQDILINVTIFTDTRRAAETDNIVDCINYSTMSKKLQAYAETAERLTVEALANDLAKICLQEKGVERVIMRVEKPGAVRFSKSVGVEIERSREE